MTLECAKCNGLTVKGIIINKMPNNPNESEKHFIEELQDFSDIKILSVIKENSKISDITINL